MPPFRSGRRKSRYAALREAAFTPLESRELSKIPRKNPALKNMIADRVERRARFDVIAARKIRNGIWKKSDLDHKWIKNLSRLYHRQGWRVQQGPTGNQQKMKRGQPNPWALYRDYEKKYPPGPKDYPEWEKKQIKKGKTPLDKGQIFIRKRQKDDKRKKGK